MPKSMISMKKLRFQLSVLRCQWIELSTWKLLRIPWKGFENIVAAMFLIKTCWCQVSSIENPSAKEKTTAWTKARSLKVAWFYDKDAGCMTKLMSDPAPANLSQPETRPTQPDPRPPRPDPRPTRPDPRPTRPDPRPTRPDPRPTRPDPCPTCPDLCLTQARLRPEPCLPKTAQDNVGTAVSWLSI